MNFSREKVFFERVRSKFHSLFNLLLFSLAKRLENCITDRENSFETVIDKMRKFLNACFKFLGFFPQAPPPRPLFLNVILKKSD